MPFQGLQFSINADCTGAISALSNVETAADHLAGRDFAFSVSPQGVDEAVREVGRVSDAVAAGSAMMSLGADTSGLDDAHGMISDLRGGVRGLSEDLGGLSGMSVGVDGASAIRGLAGEMSGLGDVLGSTAASLGEFNDVGAGFGRTSADFSRSGSEMRQEIESITGATDGLTASTRELVSVSSDGAQVMNAVRSGGTPGGVFGGSGGGSFGGGFDNSPGGSDGPPLFPPGGGGGRGGGGGGRGGGADDGGGFFDGIGGLAQPLMMGGAVGAVEGLLPGVGGLMAVKEAIKDVPELAAASKIAMLDFNSGVFQAAQGASGVGVPALLALGQTLRGFGGEVGTMAVEHMGTALAGVNDMAGQATETLKALDPAVESSMHAVFGLGDAFMQGISNPTTVTSIKTVADAMSDAGNDKGFSDLVSSLGTVAATVATPLANALGAGGNLLGMFGGEGEGPAAAAGLGGILGSKALSRSAAEAAKSGKPEIGKFAAGLTGAGILGIAAEDQQSGVDPTAGIIGGGGGALLARGLGLGGPGMMAMAAGGELLAHDPDLVGGGMFTTPGLSTQGPPGLADQIPAPLREQTSGLWDQATSGKGLSGLWDNATSTMGNLWESGGLSTQDSLAPNTPWAKSPDPASPQGVQAKAAEAQKAYAADPTNLGLYQEAAFAKAVAEARKKSNNNDDPLAAFMASGGGGGSPIVGAEGAGTWTASGGGWNTFGGPPSGGVAGVPTSGTSGLGPAVGSSVGAPGGSSGGGGGGPVVRQPGPGSSGLSMSATTLASLGIGPSSGARGAPGDAPGAVGTAGAGTPGGSGERFTLGGGAPVPAGGWSTDDRPTLGNQILSSLTDLRSTSSNMFGAMGGLPGQFPAEAGALRRDWGATQNMEGASHDQYGNASRYLGADIQAASSAIFAGGPAAIEAYTNNLADQQGLERAPDPTRSGLTSGAGASIGSAPPALADRDPHGSDSGAYYGWPANSPQAGIAPGAGRAGAQSSPAARVAGQEPGGYRGALGFGSSGPGGASQLEHLNQMMAQTQAHSMQLNQSSTQLGQTLGQVGQQGQSAAQNLQQDHAQTQSLSSGMQSLSSGAGQASSAMGELGKSAESATGSATALGAAVGGGGGDTGLSGFVNQVGTGISSAASVSGQAIAQSMAQGISSGSGSVASAAGDLGQGAVNAGASALRSKSPSQAFVDLGESTGQGGVIGVNNSMPAMAGAMTAGMGHVLDAARGVADDSGLMFGFSFVENLTTGIETAVKSSEFQQLGFGDIKSPLAKAALGAMGLLGPAGSGAQSYQLSSQEVSFATGVAANQPAPQPIVIQPQPVYLDGQLVATIADRRITVAMGKLADSYGRQRGG